MKHNYFGFTFLEILIVVSIIVTMASISFVGLNQLRVKSHDSVRLQDIATMQEALNKFKQDNGYYPGAITPGTSFSLGSKTYLRQVPSNPGNDCGVDEYQYESLGNGLSYSISYCLAYNTGHAPAGTLTAVPSNPYCSCAGKECGTNDCGVSCGTCSGDEVCGGGGTPYVCGCAAETDLAMCARNSKQCDPYDGIDNCGTARTAQCGDCAYGTCGTVEPNMCYCLGNCSNKCSPETDGCGVACTHECPAGVTQAYGFAFSNIRKTSIDVRVTRGDGDGVMIVANSSSTIGTPVNGETYSQNRNYLMAPTITGGGRILYFGTGNIVYVTGLSGSTYYYFKAFEYKTIDGVKYYNWHDATNNPRSQKTSSA